VRVLRRGKARRGPLSDAIAFHLATAAYAPRGMFATCFDAILLPENEKPALKKAHREELAEWVRTHPESFRQAAEIKAAEAAACHAAERAPLGYQAPEHEEED